MAQPDASLLFKIMKEKIDKILDNNEKLQNFLGYVHKKSLIHHNSVKSSAIRAFYFDIDFDIDQERRLSLLLDCSANYLVCGSFFARVFQDTDFEEGIHIAEKYDKNIAQGEQKISDVSSANEAMYIAIKYALESKQLHQEIRNILENLYHKDVQSENDELDEEKLKHLADESRSLAKKTRQIGSHFWQFNDDEKKLLKNYYEANLLLVECLNTDCVINPKVRKEILDTLILPIDDKSALSPE
ncbi:NACHT C-terminal helical domain 2-containing protein [Nostoc flagelliforme]